MKKEIFASPLFYDNEKLWNFLSGRSDEFDLFVFNLIMIEEALVMYFLVVGTALLFLRHIKWYWHLLTFTVFIFLGDIVPAETLASVFGQIFNSNRIANLNTETFRYILLLVPTIGLVVMMFLKKYRTVSRVVFGASGTIIFATTFVFHIVYFHTLQAVALESHTNHAKMVTLLDDKNFMPYCDMSNLKCYSGKGRDSINDIPDKWIGNYISDRLQYIKNYNQPIRFEIMKSNILGGGARTGYFVKGYDDDWKVVINQTAVKSFAKSLELSFWFQMVFAHTIWILLSNLVIVFHDIKVFRRNQIK